MKKYAYPARSNGKSQAGRMKKADIPNYRRGYKVIDIICEALVIGSVIGGMCGIVAYANYRDSVQFKTQTISSFPSRPEECNGECEPMHEEYEEFLSEA